MFYCQITHFLRNNVTCNYALHRAKSVQKPTEESKYLRRKIPPLQESFWKYVHFCQVFVFPELR